MLAQEGEDETLHPVAYASVLCKLHEEQPSLISLHLSINENFQLSLSYAAIMRKFN